MVQHMPALAQTRQQMFAHSVCLIIVFMYSIILLQKLKSVRVCTGVRKASDAQVRAT